MISCARLRRERRERRSRRLQERLLESKQLFRRLRCDIVGMSIASCRATDRKTTPYAWSIPLRCYRPFAYLGNDLLLTSLE